jgi:exosortase/archaeosortase family protein
VASCITVAPTATAGVRLSVDALSILGCTGLAVLALYLALILAFSFSTRLRTWAWTAAGIVATHYAYGWNFLRGLFARSMPDGVKAFDHQG